MQVLVTGGAGFVGSHTVDLLLTRGYRVTVLDVLDPQVHSPEGRPPAYVQRHIDAGRIHFVRAAVEDPVAVEAAIAGCDAVVHLAAAVGVGQSAYKPRYYSMSNAVGTATIIEAIVAQHRENVRLVVASSISNYGEGAGWNPVRRVMVHPERRPEDLAAGFWEPRDPIDGQPTEPMPTPEALPLDPTSVYGLSKRYTEEIALLAGRHFGISVAALRFANIFGPRQSLTNPYTGVLATFYGRLASGNPPLVFEDGRQRRDFVHVGDVAAAIVACIEREFTVPICMNIGSGHVYTLTQVLTLLRDHIGSTIEPKVLGVARAGDVRHFFPDISLARETIGYAPRISLEHGLDELVRGFREQSLDDRAEIALRELATHGLVPVNGVAVGS